MNLARHFQSNPPTKEQTRAWLGALDEYFILCPRMDRRQAVEHVPVLKTLLSQVGLTAMDAFAVSDLHAALCKAAARQWVKEP